MVNACADPDFCQREGGGGVQAQRRENSLDFFFMFVFGFFCPKFSGDAYLRGGGGGPNANFHRI